LTGAEGQQHTSLDDLRECPCCRLDDKQLRSGKKQQNNSSAALLAPNGTFRTIGKRSLLVPIGARPL
jgi:hypothetical protein